MTRIVVIDLTERGETKLQESKPSNNSEKSYKNPASSKSATKQQIEKLTNLKLTEW